MRPLDYGELAAFRTPAALYPVHERVNMTIDGKVYGTYADALWAVGKRKAFVTHLNTSTYARRLYFSWYMHYDPVTIEESCITRDSASFSHTQSKNDAISKALAEHLKEKTTENEKLRKELAAVRKREPSNTFMDMHDALKAPPAVPNLFMSQQYPTSLGFALPANLGVAHKSFLRTDATVESGVQTKIDLSSGETQTDASESSAGESQTDAETSCDVDVQTHPPATNSAETQTHLDTDAVEVNGQHSTANTAEMRDQFPATIAEAAKEQAPERLHKDTRSVSVYERPETSHDRSLFEEAFFVSRHVVEAIVSNACAANTSSIQCAETQTLAQTFVQAFAQTTEQTFVQAETQTESQTFAQTFVQTFMGTETQTDEKTFVQSTTQTDERTYAQSSEQTFAQSTTQTTEQTYTQAETQTIAQTNLEATVQQEPADAKPLAPELVDVGTDPHEMSIAPVATLMATHMATLVATPVEAQSTTTANATPAEAVAQEPLARRPETRDEGSQTTVVQKLPKALLIPF